MEKKKRAAYYLPAELVIRIFSRALAERRTQSEIIRSAVETYLENNHVER